MSSSIRFSIHRCLQCHLIELADAEYGDGLVAANFSPLDAASRDDAHAGDTLATFIAQELCDLCSGDDSVSMEERLMAGQAGMRKAAQQLLDVSDALWHELTKRMEKQYGESVPASKTGGE